jgi:hypothetical protein
VRASENERERRGRSRIYAHVYADMRLKMVEKIDPEEVLVIHRLHRGVDWCSVPWDLSGVPGYQYYEDQYL